MPAAPDGLNDLNRALGNVEAALKSLQDQQIRGQISADESRRRLYEKVEALAADISDDMRQLTGSLSTLTTRVDGLALRVTAMEPIVDDFKKEKLLREGAANRGKQMWAWVAAGSGFLGWLAHEAAPYISSLLGRSPPPHGP